MFIKAHYKEYADSLGKVISACTDFAFISILEHKIATNDPEALEIFACAYKSNQFTLRNDYRSFHRDTKKALAKFRTVCLDLNIKPIPDDEAFLGFMTTAKDFESKLTFLSKIKNICLNEQRIIPPSEFEQLFKIQQGTA